MNNENYEYLAEQVKMTGFGEALASVLKEKMAAGDPEFQLSHQIKHGEKEMDFNLNFKKSKTQDNYFFNSYDAKLTKPGEVVATRFYTDDRITAKEAFNLMEGRSVEKKYNQRKKINEGGKDVYKPIKDKTYNVWVRLDFNDADTNGHFKIREYGERQGFNLEQKLSELPIRQMRDPEDRHELMNSLKKGNTQQVTFEINGLPETRYVEANPRLRSINVYDSKMQPIQEVQQTPAVEQKENTSQKLGNKKENTEAVKDPAKKKVTRKQGVR